MTIPGRSKYGSLAQLVEHTTDNREAVGSIPTTSIVPSEQLWRARAKTPALANAGVLNGSVATVGKLHESVKLAAFGSSGVQFPSLPLFPPRGTTF